MNISYNWLKEYVSFDMTPEEVSAALTSIGNRFANALMQAFIYGI